MMKTCPKCGELNGDNSTVCFKCGTKMETSGAAYQKKCPKCGRIYDAKKDYCDDCPDTPLAVYAPAEEVAYVYDSGNSSIWIGCLRVVAWICFALIIILGILNGILLGGLKGFFTFLASIPVALVSVAALMVFLDMATDLRTIKNALVEEEE